MKKLPSIKELRQICQPRVDDLTLFAKIYRDLSVYIIKLFLYTPITPNQITLLGMLIYIGGAILFISGTPIMIIIGGLVVRFAILFDYVDGGVARYRGKTTLGGAFLDKLSDCVPQIFLFIFLSIGVYQNHPHIFAFAIGCVAVMAVVLKTLTGLCRDSIIPKRAQLGFTCWPFHTVDFFIVAATVDFFIPMPVSIVLVVLAFYGIFSLGKSIAVIAAIAKEN